MTKLMNREQLVNFVNNVPVLFLILEAKGGVAYFEDWQNDPAPREEYELALGRA